MKHKLLLLTCFVAMAFYGQAQQVEGNSSKLWTLKECLDYALANNLQVKRSELNVESNEITYNQYKMNLLPSANASASYGYNWGRGLDPVSNQFIASQRNNVSSLSGSASLTLFNGFRTQSQIKQGSHDVAASEQDLAKAKNDVSIAIVNNFLNVVFNKEQVENAQFQLASTQQQLERTRKQVEAGSLPRSEQLNLEAQVATNELNLINQSNALSAALLQLKQSMQMPAAEPFDVEIPSIDPEDLVLTQSRDDVYSVARQAMPEIRSSQMKVESAFYGVKAARGNLLPRLSLAGSVNTNYSKNAERTFVSDGGFSIGQTPLGFAQGDGLNIPVYSVQPTGRIENSYKFDNQIRDNLYKSVGLQLTIPIFNNFVSRAAVQRSIITSAQAKINATEVENTLRQNIETAFNDAIAASKSYQSSLKQVEAREEAFRMTKQRYEIGASNYVDYQVAENNLFQARSDLARAKYNFIFRKKLLDFYEGKSFEY